MNSQNTVRPASVAAARVRRGAGIAAWRPEPGWWDLLSGREPDVILERLLDGDPLRLRGLVAQAIRSGCYFLDADRIHLRALARIAHDVTIDGPPADGSWVQGHVDGALDDVLRSERRALVAASEPDSGLESLQSLSAPFGLEGGDLRAACDAFNRRVPGERQAFFALFVERLVLDAAASWCSVSAVELARRARAALVAAVEAATKSVERRAQMLVRDQSPSTPSISPCVER